VTAVVSTGIVGIGYEGQVINEFTAELVRQGIDRVVDVRLTPISRKPGFSKTRLGLALASAGIAYEHRPELGNPKDNRAGFGGSATDRQQAREHFASLLERSAASTALEELAEAATEARIAVLCFEADQSRCHRDVVLAEVARRAVTVAGSRRRAR